MTVGPLTTICGMPPLMVPFAAYPLLYVTVKSLWRHQGVVGLAMMPGLLYALMIPVQRGFSLVSLAVTAAAVVATLVGARWSFKKDAGLLPAWLAVGLALAARGLLLAFGL